MRDFYHIHLTDGFQIPTMCQAPCLIIEYREDKEKVTCPNGAYVLVIKAADQ